MSRYYSQNPSEPIRFDTVTGSTETPIEAREFNPDQQRIIESIIADAQMEEDEECDHSYNDSRSAYREVMQGTAQVCMICGHLVGNWDT